MKSKSLSRRTKIHLYKTLIRPVVTYGSECWTLSKNQELALLRFERRILRRIFGPVCIHQEWKLRTNAELQMLYQEADLVRFIKVGRLRWAGHVARMTDDQIPKKLLNEQIHGTRPVGRPKLRWADGVAADARSILGIRNWKAAALNRDDWWRLLREALTPRGL